MGIHERKEREKEQRREDIVDAAQKVFFEKGLIAATMDDIAEEAELSKGTLYLYYKSKEDLYLAVMMRGTHQLYDMFQSIVETQEATLKKLMNIGNAYMKFSKTSANYFRMFHFFQVPHFHKQVSEEVREACSRDQKKLWDLVVSLLQRAIEEKLIRAELNPVELSIILWSSTTALLLRIDNEKDLWRERMHIDLTDTLKVSNSLLWNAMLTETGRAELARISNVNTIY